MRGAQPTPLQAGRLRKRIVIEVPMASRDAYGANVPTYSTLATVWARIEPVGGRLQQSMNASALTSKATHKITIRYRDDLRVGYHRIRYGTAAAAIYPTLTAAQYTGLDAATYAALSSTGSGGTARYFHLLDASDPQKRHREMVLTVVEVTA